MVLGFRNVWVMLKIVFWHEKWWNPANLKRMRNGFIREDEIFVISADGVITLFSRSVVFHNGAIIVTKTFTLQSRQISNKE